MTWNIGTTSKRRFSAKLAGGFALAAMLALGALTSPADAAWRGDGYRDGYRGGYGYAGGYYNAPPVAYGSYYGSGYYGTPYYAPPVVYGPSVGINIGGIGIGIR